MGPQIAPLAPQVMVFHRWVHRPHQWHPRSWSSTGGSTDSTTGTPGHGLPQVGPQTAPMAPQVMVFLSYFNFTYITFLSASPSACLMSCSAVSARVQKRAFWCLCKKYKKCRSQGDSGTQATPLKSLVHKSTGRKCTLTCISHKYLNIPCPILLRSKTCVSASVSQYLDNIYGYNFGTSLNHAPPSDQRVGDVRR